MGGITGFEGRRHVRYLFAWDVTSSASDCGAFIRSLDRQNPEIRGWDTTQEETRCF